ncbi:hypothetical protein WJX74_006884 [Apatococcus lobatus]|uniref:MATH domain-containing protein n=1 Tax=Apatococcus lobatus TaxID=904363 RepID=A0AAW1SB00_9CHLO
MKELAVPGADLPNIRQWATAYSLEGVQRYINLLVQTMGHESLPCYEEIIKSASAEQICQILDQGMVADGNSVWEALSSHWLPQPQSQVSQVLLHIQLNQMEVNSLDEVVETIRSWDVSTSAAAVQQAKIALGCYTARKLIFMPASDKVDGWSGRADGCMLPAPSRTFVWRIWPWSQLSNKKVLWSPMLRYAAGSTMWQLTLRTDGAKDHLSLYLRLAFKRDGEYHAAFQLSAGSSPDHCKSTDNNFTKSGDKWGFKNFMLKSKAEDLTVDDTLSILAMLD